MIFLGGVAGVPGGGAADHDAVAANWPAWRGATGNGYSDVADPPVTWSETENLGWKVTLPGLGHSSPIIWDNTVVVTLAEPVGAAREPVYNRAEGAHDNHPVDRDHRFVVVGLDQATGEQRWETEVTRVFPHEGGHYTGSLASASPVTEGERIYAQFGSRGLFALDFDGDIVWRRDLGRMDTRHAHGEGSSPALAEGVLVVNWDHEGRSRLRGVKSATGDDLWSVDRDEMTSWSTPLIVPFEDSYQVIVSATKRVRSYDLRTGQLIWECAGLARNVVASPVAADGIVVVGNSYDHQAMMAIRLAGAQGDVTGTSSVLWSLNRMTPYVPSPLLYGGVLYFLRHNQGVLSCLDLQTGKSLRGPFRLSGLREIFASPVAAAGRIYIVGKEGLTMVFRDGEKPEVLAMNRLADRFSASPALAGEAIYLRGEKALYCLRRPPGKPTRGAEF